MLSSVDGPAAPPKASEPERSGSRPRVVLFIEDYKSDWHSRHLKAALEARGADVVATTLKDCAFDTRIESGIDIPGLDGALPHGAFVRSVSTGTLEQITKRLGILHALRASGTRVWNDARAIERCVDKSTATFLFQRAGLPTPPTRVVEGRDAALRHARTGGPLVVKPLFGSQGNGILRALEPDDLPDNDAVGEVFYLQNYVRAPDATAFEDYRVFVSRGRVLAAMRRVSATWITNVHQGAEPVPHEPDAEMHDLALAAVKAIDADYAGVDLIRDACGRLMVLEINSNPAWYGLQKVASVDIASALAEDFLAALAIGVR